MKIPKKLKLNQRKLSNEQIELGKQLLKEGNSQRWVAKKLGISRHNVLMHCKNNYAENFRKKHKIQKTRKKYHNQKKESERALERYHILSRLYPKKMKKLRKKNRERIGKEYFRLKQIEFRKKHPDYWKRFYY